MFNGTPSGSYNVTGDQIVYGVAKAWVQYNGVSTIVNQGFNTSSITYLGTGSHSVAYSVSFVDNFYAVALGHNYVTTGTNDGGISPQISSYVMNPMTTSYTSITAIGYGTGYNCSSVHYNVVR